MPFCIKCGKEIRDTDKFCYNCGNELTLISPINKVTFTKTEATERSERSSKVRGWREISQSHAAVSTAVGIIFLCDLFAIISLASGVDHLLYIFIGSIILDIILGIFMLMGKRWARTWMLFRFIIGLIVWSIIYILQNDVSSLILLIGIFIAVILLLTGTSTRLRIWGSIALVVVTFLVMVFLEVLKEILKYIPQS